MEELLVFFSVTSFVFKKIREQIAILHQHGPSTSVPNALIPMQGGHWGSDVYRLKFFSSPYY